VTFDPDLVTYDQLLETFWRHHDPTTPNRQGPDHGTQYRSAIFFHTPEQEHQARASLEAFQARFRRPIVTEVVPAETFWPAEAYHQRYHAANRWWCLSRCQLVAPPGLRSANW